MSGSDSEKASALVDKADKKVTGFKLFGKKYDEALELYERAANLYKLDKQWSEAGSVFEKMAECHMKLESPLEACSSLVDAAKAYQKTSATDAIKCLERASEMMIDAGRFSQAANVHKDLGQLYEDEVQLEKAIASYQRAADFYLGENQQGSANPCMLKVAHLAAQKEDYELAIKMFEEVAEASLRNNLLKYSVKEYLFKAMICRFASIKGLETSQDEAVQTIERYQDMDVTFQDTRESKLLWAIVDAFDKHDVDIFSNAVAEYDRIARLDEWKVNLLLIIRKKVEESEPELL
eukprot:ANDGO_08388.mRNA.1 Alpha-soluble NSF attachment protein